MASEDDIASETEEFFRNVQIQAVINNKSQYPLAAGKCLYCDEPFTKDQQIAQRRWCDNYCRDDWQAEENAKRRASGRPILSGSDLASME